MTQGSFGYNDSGSFANHQQNVWQPQGNALEQLYAQANNMFNQNQMYTGYMNQLAQQASPYMQNVANSAQGGMDQMLGGGSVGDTSDVRNQLMDSLQSTSGGSNMGRMYESIVGGSGNSYIDPMVDAMRSGYQENLDRNLSSGAMDAAAMGQSGSSRHAMSDAMLKRDALGDMSNAETMMRGNAYDTDLNMKMDIARQADSGIQSSQDRLMQMLGMADQNVSGGVNQGNNIQSMHMGPMAPYMQAMQVPWYNMNNYANVIGDPTVLSSGSSGSDSQGFDLGLSLI